MAKLIADFFERKSCIQKMRGTGVAQRMRAVMW